MVLLCQYLTNAVKRQKEDYTAWIEPITAISVSNTDIIFYHPMP
jgi:hypothetical protein